MEPYVLHYAPDNASLCVRLALEELNLPYSTALVDRPAQAHRSPAYLALNPNGLIPVLETPQGAVFETAAILLWLADVHQALAPAPQDPARAHFLKWLFFLSNTLHPALRRRFQPEKYICSDQPMQRALQDDTRRQIADCLDTLERATDLPAPFSVFDCYLCPMLRWAKIYPTDTTNDWFDLQHFPRLLERAQMCEPRASVQSAAQAEGLGPAPFSNPHLPSTPIGSATRCFFLYLICSRSVLAPRPRIRWAQWWRLRSFST
ncbi:MAG: glutathione S-transferase family protein [Roseobacter sp.]